MNAGSSTLEIKYENALKSLTPEERRMANEQLEYFQKGRWGEGYYQAMDHVITLIKNGTIARQAKHEAKKK